jgi:uncharacterized protein YdaU (DUF1376 family)
MHYYKRNLGDYAKKAGRLSMLQHGAYTLLIDACYDREQFPTMSEAVDWTWASSTAEIEAVEFVLRKFFVLEDDRYTQSRIQDELDAYREKAETNTRIAKEREAKRKESPTKREPVVDETPPNHKPLTTNQEPLTTNQEDQKHLVTGVTDFESFWSFYPRKISKSEAQKSWAKINPDQPMIDLICAGLTKYLRSAQWAADRGKYIKHPATWLNQGCWNDDPEPASNVVKINRHGDFDQTDYNEGLQAREDGTNGF